MKNRKMPPFITGLDREALSDIIQILMGTLADIALSSDLNELTMRHKANRIYNEIAIKLNRAWEEHQ